MKAKLYTLFFILIGGIVTQLNAQCTVSISSLTITGLTVNATLTGSGTSTPIQGWTWGDNTFGIGATASHTYTAAGTYTVCATYSSLTDSNCLAQACSTITVTAAVGFNEQSQLQTSLNAFPSPFTTATAINFSISQPADVEIQVYDVTGKLITTLINSEQQAGQHTIQWDATGVDAGIYFVRMKTENGVVTRRIAKQ